MSRERVRKFMVETLSASNLCWEIPGRKDTSVELTQCWAVPADRQTRLVIVEIYDGGKGFDVFPQILDNSLDGAEAAIADMTNQGF